MANYEEYAIEIPACANEQELITILKEKFDIYGLSYQDIVCTTSADDSFWTETPYHESNAAKGIKIIFNDNFTIGFGTYNNSSQPYGSVWRVSEYNVSSLGFSTSSRKIISTRRLSNNAGGAPTEYDLYYCGPYIKSTMMLFILKVNNITLFSLTNGSIAAGTQPFYTFLLNASATNISNNNTIKNLNLFTTYDCGRDDYTYSGNDEYPYPFWFMSSLYPLTILGCYGNDIKIGKISTGRILPRFSYSLSNFIVLTPITIPNTSLVLDGLYYSCYSSRNASAKIVEINGEEYLNWYNLYMKLQKDKGENEND